MNKNEICNLIDEAVEKVSMQVGESVSLRWDGGQEGDYYIDESSFLSYEEIEMIDNELDILSPQVRKFLIENDLQEEDLWVEDITNIYKSKLLKAIMDSSNGAGNVYIIERNSGDIEIWVNNASKSAIEMGGVDVLYSDDFSNWKNTDLDRDEEDTENDFDNAEIEEDLRKIGIRLI